MRRYIDKHNNFGRIWSARTKNFTISLYLSEEHSYQYDGDDEDGETQRALDAGDLVAFHSEVRVEWDGLDGEGIEVGTSHLGGSVYKDGETLQFMKDGYFKGMLNEACKDARDTMRLMRGRMPALRDWSR